MNILIIKLGALGDIVMATSLIRAIQQHHANSTISLLTTPSFAPIFAAWENLEIVAYERKGLVSMFSMLNFIRRGQFTRVYDLQGNDRSGLLCALSGIKTRVGNHPRFPYTHHPSDPWRGQCHIAERMIAVVHSAGVTVNDPLPFLPVTSAQQAAVDQWLDKRSLSDKFIVIHASASPQRPQKVWPYFDQLAESFRVLNLEIVWLGAGLDSAENIRLSTIHGHNATDAFNIGQLAYLGRRAAFALTNDSGPMHILSSADIPVYAFFGPTNWRRNHAVGQADRVFAAIDYAQGSLTQSNEHDLSNIPLDQVIKRLQKDRML